MVVVGVYHAPAQFVSPAFSPAHVRAALDEATPQALGVESRPDWLARGAFYRETYEAQGLAVPWARRRGLPVYGVDWTGDLGPDRDYAQRRHLDDVRAAKKGPGTYYYGAVSWTDVVEPKPDPELSYAAANGAAARKWTAWLDKGKDKPGSPEAYLDERNERVAERVEEAAKRHPGEVLAVVIGLAHKDDLERRLSTRGIILRQAPTLPPDLDDRLTEEDVVAALSEALDTGRAAMGRRRAERLLDRIEKSDGPWRAYFRGRRAMLEGRLDEARTAFAESGEGILPHSGRAWRLHLSLGQARLLERGRVEDLAGRRDEALKHYKALLASLKVPDYSEDQHSDYLFKASAWHAVESLIESPFKPGARVGDDETPTGFERAMERYRSGNYDEALILFRGEAAGDRRAGEMAAWCLYRKGDFPAALAEAEKAPGAESAMLRLLILRRMGRKDDAAAGAAEFRKTHLRSVPAGSWIRRELAGFEK